MSERQGNTNAMLSAEEAEVRDLIRAAGPRPDVPAEGLASVKAAVRAEWLAQVEARSRDRKGARLPRWLPVAAGLALLFLAAWWWIARDGLGRVSPVEVATIEVAGASSGLAAGTTLLTGRSIETTDAAVGLRLSGGQVLRLDSDTGIRLVSAERIELERGALYFDSQGSLGALAITTPHGTVRHLGSQFEVRLDGGGPALSVRVREGQVVLERGDERHAAEVGEALQVSATGTVSRDTVPVYGEPWSWVLDAVPAMEIEGRSLGEYLVWVSRETGWRTEFADPDLAAAAETIELHGTIEGLSPAESVSVVLPGSGLDHRLEAGILVLTRR